MLSIAAAPAVARARPFADPVRLKPVACVPTNILRISPAFRESERRATGSAGVFMVKTGRESLGSPPVFFDIDAGGKGRQYGKIFWLV
jgi:hypothetical protein